MKKMKRILSVALVCSMVFVNTAFAFTVEKIDLSEINLPSQWARTEMVNVREAGLITPSIDNLFKKDITRSEFAELVVNMTEKASGKEITAAPTSTFSDTVETNVLKAYSAGIVSGVSATEFAPNNYITREQIATMLNNAINYLEKVKETEYVVKNGDIGKYSDKDLVASWAKTGVGVLANNNIMAGTSATTLSPKAPATIEQSALLVYRLYKIVSK